MKIILKKFGGTSVGDYLRIKRIALYIKRWIKKNTKLIIVVSAMSGVTDYFSSINHKIKADFYENSVLLSTGEQITSSILSSFLNKLGIKSVSLQGWQIPILITSAIYIKNNNINSFLRKGYVVVVSGFQGINSYNRILTLKRGGSDTTALSISKYFNVYKCYIYTDVNGVYQIDPRICNSKLAKIIDFRIILELSSLGAKVLSFSSALLCIKYNINTEILSSLNFLKGTIICHKFNYKMNYCTKQEEILIKSKTCFFKKILKYLFKNSIRVDFLKINKKYFFISVNRNEEMKIIKLKEIKMIKLTKISFVGLKIRENYLKTIFFIKKVCYKHILNFNELKISFLVKTKNINECHIFFKKNMIEE
ncbi:amino acid kinase family protein [Candidatus Vidania fulgoroideorum]